MEGLRAIPDTSSYYVEATALLTETRDDYIRGMMSDARDAVRKKKVDPAKAAVKALLAEQPDHADALALDKALASGLPAAYKLVTGGPLEQKPRFDKPGFDAAIGAYKSGNFDQAISLFEAEGKKNLSTADQSRVKGYIKSVKKFRGSYGEGRAAAKAFQAEKATAPLEKAYQADQKVGGHYASELRVMLGDMNAYRAASYFAKNEYGTAAVFARKALSFQPGQASAQQVYQKAQEKAESLHQQGMTAYNQGNKALAYNFFRQVIKILPDSHPNYKEAYRLLGEIGD
jgi:tetratricopeptide (TPR) repeat protein